MLIINTHGVEDAFKYKFESSHCFGRLDIGAHVGARRRWAEGC